jgi:hypothetical protein
MEFHTTGRVLTAIVCGVLLLTCIFSCQRAAAGQQPHQCCHKSNGGKLPCHGSQSESKCPMERYLAGNSLLPQLDKSVDVAVAAPVFEPPQTGSPEVHPLSLPEAGRSVLLRSAVLRI